MGSCLTNEDRREFEEYRQQQAERAAELAAADDILARFPKTVAECPTGPCPFVSCRFHLWTEVIYSGKGVPRWRETRSFGHPQKTCALRVANAGPQTLEQTGWHMSVTREYIRQIEEWAMDALLAYDDTGRLRALLDSTTEIIEPDDEDLKIGV